MFSSRFSLAARRIQLRGLRGATRWKSGFSKNSVVQKGSFKPFAILALSLGSGFYAGNYVGEHWPGAKQHFPGPSTTALHEIEPPSYASEEDIRNAIEEFRKVVDPFRVRVDDVDLEHHADNGLSPNKFRSANKPRCVIYPLSTEEVSRIMKIAYKYNVPVVPYSGATSLEGHLRSSRNGIVIDTSRMNKVLEVCADDLDVRVQAGVGWMQLNDYLANTPGYEHLMFGCDCGPSAHVCGMVNTNAAGVHANRYGPMAHNVVSLTAVLADGTVIKTKRKPRKSSAGYNLTGMLIGSEGTLAVITEVILRLQVKSPYETVAMVQFPRIFDCTTAVSELFKLGLQMNAVEFMDADTISCINESNLITREYKNLPTLYLKLGGLNKSIVRAQIDEVKKVCKKFGAQTFEFAKNKEEAEELFSARKNALYVLMEHGYTKLDERSKLWITDVAVPLSKLATTVEEITQLFDDCPLSHAVIGHVADGNIHYCVFYTPEQYEQCSEVVAKMVDIGLKYDGTCSGEHGIGTGKRKYLEKELSASTINTMRKIKMALDPKRILNPDKIFKTDPEDHSY